jgi:hypothetical protein
VTDYYGFWQGFLVLFGVVPFLVGALGGLLWAWRKGRRGRALIPPALFGGALLSFGLLVGAVVVFRF